MRLRDRWGSVAPRGVVVAALLLAGCGDGSDSGNSTTSQPIAVLSAFPAERAAVLAHATIDETVTIDEHVFRKGTINGVRVIIAMTGIGLVNATATTSVLLENFEVRGVVVSGVAGSPYRIGDVSVPEAWALDDGSTFKVHRPWLALADELTTPGTLALERCTVVPTSGQNVCLPFDPVVVVGGVGHSSDPYNGSAYNCAPNPPTVLGREVFGCDVDDGALAGHAATARQAMRAVTAGADAESTSEDMETAAIGQEALRHHLPFIAFRATSDGSDDPLNLPGFPAQFFAYYRLAADTAAATTAAFLERLGGPRRAE